MNFEMSTGMIIAIVLAFMLFDLLIFVFIFLKRAKRGHFTSEEIQYINSNWIRIIDSFNVHSKQGIMDADKLLDYALGKKGFEGNLGEKLKKSGAMFSDINGVWRAHKLRNRIAHELEEIDVYEAKKALQQFKTALNDLGAKL